MSDGVADALGAEVMSMLIDKVCTSNTSEDAADSLVDAALERAAERMYERDSRKDSIGSPRRSPLSHARGLCPPHACFCASFA